MGEINKTYNQAFKKQVESVFSVEASEFLGYKWHGRWNRYGTHFRIAQRCQPSAEDCAGIDIGGFVYETRLSNWCVAIYNPGISCITLRPVTPHW